MPESGDVLYFFITIFYHIVIDKIRGQLFRRWYKSVFYRFEFVEVCF